MIRRLIGFILSVIVAAILFIILISFFPSKKKSVDIVNMSYVFVDTDGTEYDVFEPVHGSAVDWSFLFKKDYVGESDMDTGETIHPTSEAGETQEISNIDPNNPFNLPEGAIEQPLYKDCKTPRGVTIKHKESILAYQQRKDVPDVCNIQRRTCNNGVLDGTFTQPACDETVIYVNSNSSSKKTNSVSSNVVSYTKKQVVSYNDTSVKSELIQTPKYAKNEGAEYDKNGKLKNGEKQPKTDRKNGDEEGLIREYDSKEQINIKHYNCKSPWGEIVQHGQFVRAYEFPFGFTNASCRIELRLCVDGELLGSYGYKDCEYLDVTYEEYNTRSEASKVDENTKNRHEITDKKRRGFWGRLKSLFN